MYRFVFIIVSMILLLSVTSIAEEADGGYAGAFLRVPVGARPTAMGGAYRALSDDGSGPLYNPAGLGGLQRPLFATSYRAMGLDRSLGYLTLAFVTRQEAVIGINWLYAGSGSVAARNSDGDLLGDDISFNNHNVAIIFAKRFEDLLSLGTRLAYLQASLGDLSAFSVSFDFGAMLHLSDLVDREKRDLMPVQDIQVGVTVKNIGAKYRWDSSEMDGSGLGVIQDDKVPIEFGLGASAKFLKQKLVLAADLAKNIEQAFMPRVGAEYLAYADLALRTGYSDGRFAAGTGYKFKLGNRLLGIDYAFSTDKADEGSEHIFSFDLMF